MRNFRKNKNLAQRRHFDVILGHFDVILEILRSFWRHILKHPQNRQKTCYRRHRPLVRKLLSSTLRKCKNGNPMSHIGAKLTVRKWPKIEKWRHVVKWRHDVGTSPKWKHIILFMISNVCANITLFGWFLRKLWRKQFLNDFYRISGNVHT